MNKPIELLHYFIKEAYIIFRTNKISNILSILSLSLIFFIFSVLAVSREVGNTFATALSNQAEVSVYYEAPISSDDYIGLVKAIKDIEGVKDVTEITADEAYERMKSVLGNDAAVLSYLETNPFLAFLEVSVDLNQVESVTQALVKLDNVDTVRDNIDILQGVRRFIGIITYAFAFVSMAMGVSTVVLTGHIIRQGIYNNREQITTMNLLGAPEAFMMIPYLIEGLWITLSSGLIAALVINQSIRLVYLKADAPLPFMPMPEMKHLLNISGLLLLIASISLGLMGSIFGWYSVKEK